MQEARQKLIDLIEGIENEQTVVYLYAFSLGLVNGLEGKDSISFTGIKEAPKSVNK